MIAKKSLVTMLLVVSFVTFTFSAMADDKHSGILVWKLQANENVTPPDVALISSFLTTHVSRYSDSEVISEEDIQTILRGEEKRQQCGIEDTACMEEIGAALGVSEAISGNIGKIGTYWMLNLQRVNVNSAQVVSRSSRNIQGDIDNLIEAINGAVAELFGKQVLAPISSAAKKKTKKSDSSSTGLLEVSSTPGGAEVWLDEQGKGKTPCEMTLDSGKHQVEIKLDGYTTTKQSVLIEPDETTRLSILLNRDDRGNTYKKYGYVTFFSGIGLAALGGVATWISSQKADDYHHAKTSAEMNSAKNEGETWMGVAYSSYAVGGALIATGITLWVLSAKNKEASDKPQVAFGPIPNGSGGVLVVNGRW